MQFNLLSLWAYLPWLLITITLFYLVGHFFRSALTLGENDESGYFSVFAKSFTGLLIVITLYAIIKTGGRTCFMGAIAGVVYFLVLKKRSFQKPTLTFVSGEKRALLVFFAFVLISFLGLLYGWTYNASQHTLNSIFDFHFYAQVSSFLGKTGIESLKFDFLDPASAGLYPYHYGMLWLNAFIAEVFHVNHMFSLLLVTMPILFAFVAFSMSALISVMFPSKSFLPLLGWIIWILGPLGFLKLNVYTVFGPTIGQTISAEPKAIMVYVFFIISIIYFVKKDFVTMTGVLILMPIYYLPVLPTVYASATITLIYMAAKKMISLKTLAYGIGGMVVTSIFITTFYFSQKGGMQSSMFAQNSSEHMFTLSKIKGMVGAVLRLCLIMVTTLSPFILLFLAILIFKRKVIKISLSAALFTGCLFIFSSLFFGLYFSVLDSEQYFSKSFIPFAIILIAILIVYVVQSKNIVLRIVSSVFIMVALFYAKPFVWNYQNRAGIKVNLPVAAAFLKDANQNDSLRMAYLNSDCFFQFPDRYNSRTYVPFKYFGFFVDPFINASLDMPSATDSIDCDKEHENPYTIENLKSRTFARFIDTLKSNNSFTSLGASRVAFIKAYRLNALAWDERVTLNKELAAMIDSSTILYDSIPSYHFTNYYIARLKP